MEINNDFSIFTVLNSRDPSFANLGEGEQIRAVQIIQKNPEILQKRLEQVDISFRSLPLENREKITDYLVKTSLMPGIEGVNYTSTDQQEAYKQASKGFNTVVEMGEQKNVFTPEQLNDLKTIQQDYQQKVDLFNRAESFGGQNPSPNVHPPIQPLSNESSFDYAKRMYKEFDKGVEAGLREFGVGVYTTYAKLLGALQYDKLLDAIGIDSSFMKDEELLKLNQSVADFKKKVVNSPIAQTGYWLSYLTPYMAAGSVVGVETTGTLGARWLGNVFRNIASGSLITSAKKGGNISLGFDAEDAGKELAIDFAFDVAIPTLGTAIGQAAKAASSSERGIFAQIKSKIDNIINSPDKDDVEKIKEFGGLLEQVADSNTIPQEVKAKLDEIANKVGMYPLKIAEESGMDLLSIVEKAKTVNNKNAFKFKVNISPEGDINVKAIDKLKNTTSQVKKIKNTRKANIALTARQELEEMLNSSDWTPPTSQTASESVNKVTDNINTTKSDSPTTDTNITNLNVGVPLGKSAIAGGLGGMAVDIDRDEDRDFRDFLIGAFVGGLFTEGGLKIYNKLHPEARKIVDNDLKEIEKWIDLTPRRLSQKFDSIRQMYDSYHKNVAKKHTLIAHLESKLDEMGLFTRLKKEKTFKKAFADVMKLMDKYNDKIVQLEKDAGQFDPKEMSEIAKGVIRDYVAKNYADVNPEAVLALYNSWLDVARTGKAIAIKNIKKRLAGQDEVINKFRRQIGEIKYYMPRMREEGNVYIRAYKDGKEVWASMSDAPLWKNEIYEPRKIRKLREQLKKQYGITDKDIVVTPRKDVKDIYEYADPSMMESILTRSLENVNADEEVKELLKNAIAEDIANAYKSFGFMSRGIKRKTDYIEGFEVDRIDEVIAKYIHGLAGFESKTNLLDEMHEAIRFIPKENVNELKTAKKYMEHLLRNETAADRFGNNLKKVMFLKMIGAKFSTPILNLTQTVTATIPRLLSHYSATDIHKEHAKSAVKAVRILKQLKADKNNLNFKFLSKAENKAIVKALLEGDLYAKNAKELTGTIKGNKFMTVTDKITDIAAKPLSVTEQFNRISTTLTAFNLKYNGKNFSEALDYAKNINLDTQFDYSKANVPFFAQGKSKTKAAMRASLAFRNHAIGMWNLYQQMLDEKNYKGLLYSTAALGVLGGLSAYPFVNAAIEILKKDYGIDIEREIKKETGISDKLYEVIMNGLPTLLGIDMSDLIAFNLPFTGTYNLDKPLPLYILEEIGGAPVSFAETIGRGTKQISEGEFGKAAESLFPIAGGEKALKAYRLYSEGFRDRQGIPDYLYNPETQEFEEGKLTASEAINKAIGFQTIKERDYYESKSQAMSKHYQEKKQILVNKAIKLFTNPNVTEKSKEKIINEIDKYNQRLIKYYPEGAKKLRITIKSLLNAAKSKNEEAMLTLMISKMSGEEIKKLYNETED